jgi:hypothetical protein
MQKNNTAQSITAHPLDSDLSILSIMQHVSIREVSEVPTTSSTPRFYFLATYTHYWYLRTLLPTPFYGPLLYPAERRHFSCSRIVICAWKY